MDSEKFVTRSVSVSFTTPAFLGNNRQSAQWRTPPFKALLRQAWRMVYLSDQDAGQDPTCGSFIREMRGAERRLFGAAAEKGRDVGQSKVRMRLDSWADGTLVAFKGAGKTVDHPEVRRNRVSSDLYLGYGPLEYNRASSNRAGIKHGKAIDAGESAVWQLAFPESAERPIDEALNIIALVGTLGGRSRNGWGSIHLDVNSSEDRHRFSFTNVSQRLIKDWKNCLQADWAHAFGKNADGLLVWRSEELNDWEMAIKRLAEIKIKVRTQFKFERTRQRQIEQRHLLAYPVTNHSVGKWENSARLPNSLRFKVLRSARDTNKLIVQVAHLPCRPPPAQFTGIDHEMLLSTWQQVHATLDAGSLRLQRLVFDSMDA